MSARAWLGAGLALLALACGSEGPRPRNLILVSLDTVRADHIGVYGRADAGTPVLDNLARGGVRFADAMAPAPLTLPSHATLVTGADPLRHGVRHNRLFSLPDEAVTLAERLAAAGFRTGAFVGSIVLGRSSGFAQGFERYTQPETERARGLFFLGERPASEVNRDARAWLEEIGDDPFFLFVHYMEAHAPYQPPEPERSRFADRPYQGEVAAMDRALGELLAPLQAQGRLGDTLLIVVADHGESLQEHGEVSHGIFVYQSTLHVPFLVAGPGIGAGRVIEAPVGLVDVTPTVLDAFGLERPRELDGRSLWPLLTGAGPAPERALYAESFAPRYDFGWAELRALRSGPDKLVSAPRPELYRLADDPDEKRDRSDADPARLAALSRQLAERVARIEAEAGPAAGPVLAAETREALEALGYLSGVHADDERAAPRPDPKDVVQHAVELERAGRLLRAGRTAEAQQRLRALLADNPAFVEARVRLIVALVLAGDTAGAEAQSRLLAEAARGLPDGARVAVRGYRVTASAYLEQGRLEDAARQLERALALDAPDAAVTLAAVYHELGRRDEATALLERLHAGGGASDRSRALLRYLEEGGAPPESLLPRADSGKR